MFSLIVIMLILNPSWTMSGTQNRSLIQRKRYLTCSRSEYRPRNRDYCCNKCIRGHYIKDDCMGPHTRTLCEPCPPESFLAYENALSKCKSCTVCDPVLYQVEQSSCQPHIDRICRCPPDTFKFVIDSNTFICRNCSWCRNEILQQCTATSDSICSCDLNFFFNMEMKTCIDCDRCVGNFQCSQCPQPSHTDGTYHSLSLTACVVMAILGLSGLGFFIYWRARCCCSELGRAKSHGNRKEMEIMVKDVHCPQTLMPIQEEGSVRFSILSPWAETRLPDCVEGARLSPLPHNTQVNYIIADLVPASRWREFARRLGLSDAAIERAELDGRPSYREAQYQMFQIWREKQGSQGASLDIVCQALRDMDLTVCAEELQDRLR